MHIWKSMRYWGFFSRAAGLRYIGIESSPMVGELLCTGRTHKCMFGSQLMGRKTYSKNTPPFSPHFFYGAGGLKPVCRMSE